MGGERETGQKRGEKKGRWGDRKRRKQTVIESEIER